MNHPLHLEIGKNIENLLKSKSTCRVLLDPACGGSHNLPLFNCATKSNDTEYCDVDILIIKDNKIKVIIEIEEANIKPTQICGKLLTSALTKCYIHATDKSNTNYETIDMDDNVLFIQIGDKSKLKVQSKKPGQFKNIKNSIKGILPVSGSSVKEYELFMYQCGDNYSDLNKTILTHV
jgi:hypothetical protein